MTLALLAVCAVAGLALYLAARGTLQRAGIV